MFGDALKKKLDNGGVLVGTIVDSCCSDMVEIIGLVGFDFAMIDGEHSPADPALAADLLRAAEARGLPALVRTPNFQASTILRFMDIGASGIMAPLVHTADDAKAVVDAAKYGPRGCRGTAMMRGADFGLIPAKEYFAAANERTFVIVQVESMEGIRNLSAIAETPGIDCVFIGPYDLSQTMGMPGEVDSPKVLEVIRDAARTIRAAGAAAGLGGIATPENCRDFVEWGFQMFLYSADLYIFANAAKELASRFKKGLAHKRR